METDPRGSKSPASAKDEMAQISKTVSLKLQTQELVTYNIVYTTEILVAQITHPAIQTASRCSNEKKTPRVQGGAYEK